MTRIMVRDADGSVEGWFDQESATHFKGARKFDGENMACVHLKDGTRHQHLYRTRGGRWVRLTQSQWAGEEPLWEYVTDEAAREWLIINGDDDVVEQYWGPVEEERAPGGRPSTGDPVKVNLPPEHIGRLDALAEERGTTRAALIRAAVAAYLIGT